MQIREIMTRDVEVVHPDTPLKEVAKAMKSLNVGMVPVCDREELVGMVTDRDIMVRATAQGWEPAKTCADRVMTKEIVYCFDDQDVKDATRLMEEKQIRRLPVLSRNKRHVGVVSLGDIAVRMGDRKTAGKTIRHVSEPAQPNR